MVTETKPPEVPSTPPLTESKPRTSVSTATFKVPPAIGCSAANAAWPVASASTAAAAAAPIGFRMVVGTVVLSMPRSSLST